MYSRIVSIIFLGVLLLASSLSVAESSCRYIFGSRLYYDIKALKRKNKESDFHPRFVDIAEERILQKRWNEEPDNIPKLLKFLLPQGVHFIKRQLYQPGSATTVKLGEWGNEIIARAHYKHGERVYHTNVAFSVRALIDNLKDGANHNWLVGKNANAAFLFLHGGGTKSTGFHVAGDIITHWSQYGVDVVSIDLPWHAQGHREFVDAETDIKIIGSFVKKYIPPHVPLFVVGHSWGSVFAEQLMRMTDRPSKEFSFHNNLMGVAMLSTAVDAAPGKSKQEKYAAYFKRLKESKRRSHTEAPEGELHIYENIVRDGKTSPLGGAYSMNVISQLDQTTPWHQGRKFIPGLMVVGTKDSLVYFGFEDLYEVYKKLANVEAHYLDKLMPHDPKGEIHEVGHDVFITLDPKTREPIVNVLLKNFIAKQLAFGVLKTNVVREIQSASNDNVLLKDTVIDTVRGLKSFDTLKDFLETDQFAQRVLDSEFLDNVYNNYINQSASFTLKKQKPVIPDFIRLMQLTANELSFREFIPEFVYYEEKETATYISYKKEKTHEQARKILEVLGNYSTPPRRIDHVLQEILNSSNKVDLSFLRTGIEFITVELFREGGEFKLNNKKVERALIALKEEIEKLIDPNLSSNKTLSDIHQQTKQILDEYDAFFASANSNSASNKISGLTDSVIKANSLDEVRRVVAPSQLPKPVLKKVMMLMEEYLTIKSLASFDYVPVLESFRTLNIPYKHRRKALDIIKQLPTVTENIKQRNEKYLEAIRERNRIRREYNTLLDDVKKNIKLLKDVFKNSNYRPPAILLEAHNRSAEELKEVVKAQEEMDKALDEVFREGEGLQDTKITEMLEERRSVIDNFISLYRQYILNRQTLRQELVVAGERGDMGVEFKNIITSLYGYGSGGRTSVVGPRNSYASLKSVVVDLAKAEVKVHYFQKLRRENKEEYNGLMNDLERIIAKHRQPGERELALVTDAANLFNVTEYPLIRLLNGEYGNIQLEGNREAVVRYIESNKHKGVSAKAVNHWKSLQSKVPPVLPTASD